MSNDINQEMEEIAKNMEKSITNQKDELFKTIKAIGPEGLKKAMPNLSETERKLLKSALEEMIKAAQLTKATEMKVDGAKVIEGKLQDLKVKEEKADDEEDEKLVQDKNKEIKHQGDDSVLEGQVIKGCDAEEKSKMKSCVKDVEKEGKSKDSAFAICTESVKKADDEVETEDDKKEDSPADKKEDKKEDEKEVKIEKGEAEVEMEDGKKKVEMDLKDFKDEHKKLPKVLESKDKEDDKKEAKEQKAELKDVEKQAKTVKEEKEDVKKGAMKESASEMLSECDNNSLLKALTLGRNHHFSMNDYLDAEEAKAKEPVKKSEVNEDANDINSILEKGEDISLNDYLNGYEAHKPQGHKEPSFDISDMATAMGLTAEEAKKILG